MGGCTSIGGVKTAPEGFDATVPSESIANQGKEGKHRVTVAVGTPFPKRPFFCKLSKRSWAKIEELFSKMDPDGSNAVTREEAAMFFKGTFGKMSADAMFNEVDTDKSGAITADEFVEFWLHVRWHGYKDKDLVDELDLLIEGGAWVDFHDGRSTEGQAQEFPTRPIICRLSGKAWRKCEEVFQTMHCSEKKVITRESAAKHFKGAFRQKSVDAMFNEIDVNNHGQIAGKAWMQFWLQVRASGYKEKDILDELENIKDGETWVDWKDGRSTA